MVRIILSVLLFLCSSASAINYDIPLISHFDKTLYNAANQNWSISQDEKGFIYVANNRCLLEYNGYVWKNYFLPTNMNVRSVACYKNRVYCGSYESFGYWERDKYGELKYSSLLDRLQKFNFHNEEIWTITAIGDEVYFQSFTSIFKYDIKNDIVKAIELYNTSSFLFKVKDKLYTHLLNGGIYELKDDKLIEYNVSDFFKDKSIKSILSYGNDKLLITTSMHGIFIVDSECVKEYNKALNARLASYEINSFIETDNSFVIGTILHGILIVSKDGEIQNEINKANSLQNNTVLNLFEDKSKNVWVAMDIGIDCISKSSNLYYYHDITGKLGSVYSAALYRDFLYVGTNHGLFRKKYRSSDNFQFVKNSQGQIWDLQVIDDVLFCGHNDGTYRYDNDGIKKISDVTGGYCIKEITKGNKKYLIQSTYTKLVVYVKDVKGRWVQRNVIEGLMDPIRFIEVDHLGNIWCSHLKRGLYKISLDKDLYKILDTKHYNGANCFDNDYIINVNKIDNRIVFSNNKKLFTFDDIHDNIIEFEKLNTLLGDYKMSSRIINANANKYWLIGNNKLVLAEIYKDSFRIIKTITHRRIIKNLVDENENIIKIEKDKFLICLDNGYAIYNDIEADSDNLESNVSVNSIHCIYIDKKEAFACDSKSIELEYDYRDIIIDLSNTNYGLDSELSYFVNANDTIWHKVSPKGVIHLSDLPSGEYTLDVRSKDRILFSIFIKVKLAWYKTIWAFILFLFSFLLFVYVLRYFVLSYIKKQELRIDIEKNRLQKIKDRENEKIMINIKNESLNSEIINKSKQLASSTISLIEKKDLLIKIRKELLAQKEALGSQYPNKYCNVIVGMIDDNLNDENDWELFQNNFNRAHNYFFKNISAKHPDLTSNDLRLCAYLKMNLSSKEIASLMNISPKSIEVARYRIRKKMDLNKEESLAGYIMTF